MFSSLPPQWRGGRTMWRCGATASVRLRPTARSTACWSNGWGRATPGRTASRRSTRRAACPAGPHSTSSQVRRRRSRTVIPTRFWLKHNSYKWCWGTWQPWNTCWLTHKSCHPLPALLRLTFCLNQHKGGAGAQHPNRRAPRSHGCHGNPSILKAAGSRPASHKGLPGLKDSNGIRNEHHECVFSEAELCAVNSASPVLSTNASVHSAAVSPAARRLRCHIRPVESNLAGVFLAALLFSRGNCSLLYVPVWDYCCNHRVF